MHVVLVHEDETSRVDFEVIERLVDSREAAVRPPTEGVGCLPCLGRSLPQTIDDAQALEYRWFSLLDGRQGFAEHTPDLAYCPHIRQQALVELPFNRVPRSPYAFVECPRAGAPLPPRPIGGTV
jgi:hypothetical protein